MCIHQSVDVAKCNQHLARKLDLEGVCLGKLGEKIEAMNGECRYDGTHDQDELLRSTVG